MEAIDKINSRYECCLKELFYNTEYEKFKDLLREFRIQEEEKSFSKALKPFFITLDQRQEFSRITESLLNIFEKVSAAFYKEKKIREFLTLNGRIGNYIEIEHGYSRNQVLVRLDAFYNFSNNTLKFLEVNCDNPSGIGINDQLIQIFHRLPTMQFLKNEFNIKNDHLIDSLANVLIKKYKEHCLAFRKPEEKEPLIAVVCSRNSFIRNDVNFIINFLKEKGLNVKYADPRDFIYDGKVLLLNGEKVDIVYRDTMKDFFRSESSGKIHSKLRNKILEITRDTCLHNDLINRCLKRGYFGHAEDIIQAYSDHSVCVINPFSASICSQKAVFALIQDEQFKSLFNDEELDIIEKYIPWSRILKPYETCFENKKIYLVDFVKENKDKFVLKPNKGFGGKGILIGSQNDAGEWNKIINKIIERDLKYVVQEYVHIPVENFPTFQKGLFKGFSPQHVNLNFWGIDGKFAGGYVRASNKKIVNITQGGADVPLFFLTN